MSEFTDYLKEIFADFGEINVRRMFGGHGVFYDGLMIALVADDELYLKADAISAPKFEAQQLAQFTYQKGDKSVYMFFYQAPGEALDNADEMREWAQAAYEAALRSKK